MGSSQRLADWILDRGSIVLVVVLLSTGVFLGGLTHLETDTSLGQFEDDSAEREALAYTSTNFTPPEERDRTAVLIAVDANGTDVFTRESLVETLELQRSIRENERIAPTLAAETPTIGIENLVATALLRADEIAELEDRAGTLAEREATLREKNRTLRSGLEEIRDLEEAYQSINQSHESGEIDTATYRNESATIEREIEDVIAETTVNLTPEETAQFERAVTSVRAIQAELSRLDPDEFDSDAGYEHARNRLEADLASAYADGTVAILVDEYEALRADHANLQADWERLVTESEPPLEDQIDAVSSANQSAIDETIDGVLAGDLGAFDDLARDLLPADAADTPTRADTRLVIVTQQLDPAAEATGIDAIEDRHVDGQLAVRGVVHEHGAASDHEYEIFGFGLLLDELEGALLESVVLIVPAAILLILGLLWLTYRDPIDVAITVVGLVIVSIWTLGFMGWTGIVLNQALVAVPILVIGLSIDYAVHLLMRERETSAKSGGAIEATSRANDRSMRVALAGVGIALGLVTVTTAIGFLSNLVSPVGPIRAFGVVSAVGIASALVVFGAFVPVLKTRLSARREHRREPRSLGGSRAGARLSAGIARGVERSPLLIIACVLLVTAGGLAAAPAVDTSLDETDTLADEPPGWTDHLPDRIAPGDPAMRDSMALMDDRFAYRGAQEEVLIRGEVTHPDTIAGVVAAQQAAREADTVAVPGDGNVALESPHTLMIQVAEEDESFAARFDLADRSGDGVPDQNIAALYEGLFEADPDDARGVIHRTEDGDFEAIRLLIEVDANAEPAAVAADIDSIAAAFEEEQPPAAQARAIATGETVVEHRLEQATFRALGESFVLSVAAILLVLGVRYRRTVGCASLAVVTLLPIVLVVSWILGTMALLDIPLNVFTAMIASLTVGLGVAYCIHVSSRFRVERRANAPCREAIHRTIRGTGTALFASALTTVAGVSVLVLATIPMLRQFGVITALMIVYAFVASVLVLPALLVLWTRWRDGVSDNGGGLP